MHRRSGVYLPNTYNSGTGQIWLNNLRCTGNEMSFHNCTHNAWGVHNCNHSEDVSIRCLQGTPLCYTLSSATIHFLYNTLHV